MSDSTSPIWSEAIDYFACFYCNLKIYSKNHKSVSSKPLEKWVNHPVCDECYKPIQEAMDRGYTV